MLSYKELAKACSTNDDKAQTQEGYQEVFGELGVDRQGVDKAAEQRAMRVILLLVRNVPPSELFQQQAFQTDTEENLVLSEEKLFALLRSIWIDGALAGIRAKTKEARETIRDLIKGYGGDCN